MLGLSDGIRALGLTGLFVGFIGAVTLYIKSAPAERPTWYKGQPLSKGGKR